MVTHALTDQFSTTGEWFLPNAPAASLFGSLSFVPSELIRLELNGAWSALDEVVARIVGVRPVVHGRTRDGETITLLRAHHNSLSLNLGPRGSAAKEQLVSTQLIVGAHLQADEPLAEMRCRIPGLPLWLGRPVVEVDFDSENGTHVTTYKAKCPPPDKIHVPAIDAAVTFGVSFHPNINPYQIVGNSSGWITFRPTKPRPLGWFLEQLEKITTLITFIAGTPMATDLILLPIHDEPPSEASLLLTQGDVELCRHKHETEFFLTRGRLGEIFPGLVASWFEKFPTVQMPSQLGMSVLGSQRLWLHVEFLSLMQSLEGFHRAVLDGLYMKPEEYEAVARTLCTAIPPNLSNDHRAALKARIRYGNEASLAKRLNALANRFSTPVRQQIFGRDGRVPRAWIDTRNYYTHWDEASREMVLENQGMIHANLRMRHFLRALYLDLVGVPHPIIQESLSNSCRESQHLLQANRQA